MNRIWTSHRAAADWADFRKRIFVGFLCFGGGGLELFEGFLCATERYRSVTEEEKAQQARTKRDFLLAESDWVTIKAVDQNAKDSLGIQVPTAWLDYRQALRDITDNANFPNLAESDWPTKP